MSWTGNIEELKEKYWNGETSLKEELFLKNHYQDINGDDIDGLYFQFLNKEHSIQYTPVVRKGIVYQLRRSIPAIAAGLVILLASVLVINQNRIGQKSNIRYAQTPEEALLITQSAFAIINNEVNQGNDLFKSNLNEFDKVLFFN